MAHTCLQEESMTLRGKVKKIWDVIVRFFTIVMTARISIIIVVVSAFLFFNVAQVKDAVIALGNFGHVFQFIITSIAGLIWALLLWYWARAFFYLDYHKDPLLPWEQAIVIHTPRILGGSGLLVLGITFLSSGITLLEQEQHGAGNLIIFGCLYFVYTALFLFFVYYRRKIFNLDMKFVAKNSATTAVKDPTVDEGFLPFRDLPPVTRIILITVTLVYLLILFLLILWPISLTIFLGDGVTIFIICISIWIPVLYWILYGSKRTGLPLYFFLIIIIAIFSLFNSNKNVRIMDDPDVPVTRNETMDEYYGSWYKARSGKMPGQNKNNTKEVREENRIPFVIVLSEGGGIRAAYWGAGLLSALHENYGKFSESVFGIYGISGGSFAGSVFDSLLKFYQDNPAIYKKNMIRTLSNDIVGKDYLSPVIAAMFTREIVQMILPFPVHSFDHAKVFEKTWEYHWAATFRESEILKEGDSFSFASPFTSIWEKDTDYRIPRLFLGTTRVEDGTPFLVSNIKLKKPLGSIYPQLGSTGDFYWFTSDLDVAISTASLLSARFPYVGPAGTCVRDNNFAGFVDGGYFDNTGANTAYSCLSAIKTAFKEDPGDVENSVLRREIIPLVIYIKNGSVVTDQTFTGPTMLYQATAPIDCSFNTRESHTTNTLDRLEEYIRIYRGIFATVSLESFDEADPAAFDIPLGWALSRSTQEEIDKRIDKIIEASRPDNSETTGKGKEAIEMKKLKRILTLVMEYGGE
jgi:predicted acylesterase/phospholipase RssA